MKIQEYSLVLVCLLSVGNGCDRNTDYRKLHFDATLVDTHNDVVQRMLGGEDISVRTSHGHSDLPRLLEGGVDIEMFSIWVPPERVTRSYYDQANEQIDLIEGFVQRNSTQVGLARSSEEIERLLKEGKFVTMLGLEGGHPIDNDLKKLEHFYERGVRYMTLTWNNSTDWATSAKDETDPNLKLERKGLAEFGKQIVRRMNELGMMIDISHVGELTFWDVMKVTTKPVIASHSSVWTLCPHRRNLKDDQLKAIATNGGVVFINFNPGFIDSTYAAKEATMQEKYKARIDSLEKTVAADEFLRSQYVADLMKDEYFPIRPSLSTLIDHFDYVAKLIGVDHVGIGSDFDGIHVTPRDMDDVTHLPNITRELLKRGYSEDDVRKILGGNFLRVLREVEVH
ncbi:MAG: membrane dipeptidase [Ignavibacteriae bacterium]|nr:membrane dipeptidase [Ignavibacteriota bacterium]